MDRVPVRVATCAFTLAQVGCNTLLGLDELKVVTSEVGDPCQTHLDCAGLPAAAGPALCVAPGGRCVSVQSEDCKLVTGDPTVENAILIGSLFPLSGPQAMASLHRQQSVALAVEQINAVGGIPRVGSEGNRHPLALVSCDTADDSQRAAVHLVEALRVPAIVGPTYSQDVLDLSNQLTAEAGTLLVSPTAVASSIVDLIDHDLTWLMVPTDVQRAPLMIRQINELEASIREETGEEEIRLGVAFRDDALGIGTRSSLNELVLNGRPLTDSANLNVNIRLNPYEANADYSELVAEYLAFAPQIVVLAGTAEAVTGIIVPLEQQWSGRQRPEYVVIDSLKLPELIEAVRENPDLRRRIRGTGVAPAPESSAVYDAFRLDYQIRYPMSMDVVSGMPRAYDATFAIAYAIAATSETPIRGATIAKGLRKLDSGLATEITNTKILAAFRELASGKRIRALGTFGPLSWDGQGAIAAGTIEIWCIGLADSTPEYVSSGLSFDVATQTFDGSYAACD